jgi:hypothetical protein
MRELRRSQAQSDENGGTRFAPPASIPMLSSKEPAMAKCDVCGNDYDKSFTITMGGKLHVFDSFECAIHALAPVCRHCGCKVVGHGVEKDGTIFCCAHCAHENGVHGLTDRVSKPELAYPGQSQSQLFPPSPMVMP